MSHPSPDWKTLLREEATRVGYALSLERVEKVARYFEQLCQWGSRINLTASLEPKILVQKHAVDAFVLAPYLMNESVLKEQWADVGSGGGLPGVLMSILCEPKEMTFVEPNHKKASFLSTAVYDLKLPATIRCCKLEESNLNAQDVLMSRATWAPETWAEKALGHVQPMGKIIVFFGKDPGEEWAVPGATLERNISYSLTDGSQRWILILKK